MSSITHPTGRTRPFTAPETLRAIARMMQAPAPGSTPLPPPLSVSGINNSAIATVLSLGRGAIHALCQWADALETVHSVVITGGWDDLSVNIRVTGSTPTGPVITVSITAPTEGPYALPLAMHVPYEAQRPLSMYTLHSLDTTELVPAGAR